MAGLIITQGGVSQSYGNPDDDARAQATAAALRQTTGEGSDYWRTTNEANTAAGLDVSALRAMNPIDLTNEQGLAAYGPQWAWVKGTDRNAATSPERPAGSPDFGPQPSPTSSDYSVQGYLDSIRWNGTTDQWGRDAQQIQYDLGESGIDGGGFGYNEGDVQAFFDNLNPTTVTPPVNNGMDQDGNQNGRVDAPPVGNPTGPSTGQPDYGTPPVGQPTQPTVPTTPTTPTTPTPPTQPTTPTTPTPPVAAPVAPMPTGDLWKTNSLNNDFYNNQFARLLQQQDQQQLDVGAAKEARAAAAANPETTLSWDWLEGGLPDIAVGGQESWGGRDDSLTGLTNSEILGQIRGDINPETYDWFRDTWDTNGLGDSQFWGANSTDLDRFNQVAVDGAGGPLARSYHEDARNAIWNYNAPAAGIPDGYAAPVAGMNAQGGAYGTMPVGQNAPVAGYTNSGGYGGGNGGYSTGGIPL